jgi:nuclear pore complex protein Nup205
VIRFHRRREYILLCLRILMRTALDGGDSGDGSDTAEVVRVDALQLAVQYIVGVNESGNLANAFGFWTKCLTTMESIEKWLQFIAERVQSTQVVGQVPLLASWRL